MIDILTSLTNKNVYTRLVLKEMCRPYTFIVHINTMCTIVLASLKYFPHPCDIWLSHSIFTLEAKESMDFIATCTVAIRKDSFNFLYLKAGSGNEAKSGSEYTFINNILLEHATPVHLRLV